MITHRRRRPTPLPFVWSPPDFASGFINGIALGIVLGMAFAVILGVLRG